MLIIDNIRLKLPSRPHLYENVISVWKKAMTAVESLVSGIAQSIQCAEVFLGLSAWHLYPDMSVLGPQMKHIDQMDDLIPKGGHITIGLRSSVPEQEGGVSWSMPLASLRYYGRPVVSERSLSSNSMRVSFRRLVQIALGSAISGCGDDASDLDAVVISSVYYRFERIQMKKSKQVQNGVCENWIALFGREACQYLQGKGPDRKESSRFISLGRRRYGSFLSDQHPPPIFGLGHPSTFLSVLDVEKQITGLREIAATINTGLDLEGAIIRYFPNNSNIAEYASVFPQPIPQTTHKLHRRWIAKVLSKDDISRGQPRQNTEMLPVTRSLQIMHQTAEPCGFLSILGRQRVNTRPELSPPTDKARLCRSSRRQTSFGMEPWGKWPQLWKQEISIVVWLLDSSSLSTSHKVEEHLVQA